MNNQDQLFHYSRSLVPINAMREHHVLALLDNIEQLLFFKGDTLLSQGDSTPFLMYLLHGEILLTHADGRSRIINAQSHLLPIVQFQKECFSAEAITDCKVLKVDKQQLDSLLTWSQVADYMEVDIAYQRELDDDVEWMTTVLNSNLFYKIPPLNICDIFSKLKPHIVKKNDVILNQGDLGDCCYFIKNGAAEVLRIDSGSAPVKLADITIGRCFGEDALINNTVRNATVKMSSDGVLMSLHQQDFKRLLEEPDVPSIEYHSFACSHQDDFVWLDVRTQEEYEYKHIRGAIHIPLNLLRVKIRMLDNNLRYRVYCNTSSRSHAAAFLLSQKGYDVTILDGGLSQLSQQQVDLLLGVEEEELQQQFS